MLYMVRKNITRYQTRNERDNDFWTSITRNLLLKNSHVIYSNSSTVVQNVSWGSIKTRQYQSLSSCVDNMGGAVEKGYNWKKRFQVLKVIAVYERHFISEVIRTYNNREESRCFEDCQEKGDIYSSRWKKQTIFILILARKDRVIYTLIKLKNPSLI